MFNTIVFEPLYNCMIYIMDVLPWADVGTVIIIFTVIIRLILFPLYKHSLLSQLKIKEVEPEVQKIRAKYPDDKMLQQTKVMEFYKERGISLSRSMLLTFLQLPILAALVSVFYALIPTIHVESLYSFVHVPVVKSYLWGLSLVNKNIYLIVAASVIQFLQIHFSLLNQAQKRSAELAPAAPDSMAQAMNSTNKGMQFFVPIVIFISLYWLIPARFPQASSVIAIYMAVSTLFTLGQEIYIRKVHLK